MKKRKNHSPEFKAKVALEAIRPAEARAARDMIDRVHKRFGIKPDKLVADSGCGSVEMLGCTGLSTLSLRFNGNSACSLGLGAFCRTMIADLIG